jgi:hypothetical protein
MLFIIFCVLQFTNGQDAPDSLFPKRVNVYIVNNITNLQLGVHCKDKHTDLGYQQLNFGQTYFFTFKTKPFLENKLYFCRISWTNEFYYFDIYIEHRDQHQCGKQCHWKIDKSGPCMIKSESYECYPWNPKVDTEEGRQLGEDKNIYN